MDKNKKQIVAIIILLVIIIITSILGIYAYARYIAQENGSAIAQVAKWNFKVNEATTKFQEINLADTINFEHVAEKRVAPGTSGSFKLELDPRGSEVAIDYFIRMNVKNKPTNLKFYTDELHTQEIEMSETNSMLITGGIELVDVTKIKNEMIYWNWLYETGNTESEIVTNDEIDTKESGMEIKLEIEVIAEQRFNGTETLYQRSITLDNEKDNYEVGEKIGLSIEFNQNVYADEQKNAIQVNNAPELLIQFEGNSAEQANILNEIKVASNSVVKIAETSNDVVRKAVFDRVEGNKIKYIYTVTETDKGKVKVVKCTGKVYSTNSGACRVRTMQFGEVNNGENDLGKNYLFGGNNDVEWYGGYNAGDGEGKGTYKITDEYLEVQTFTTWCSYAIQTVDIIDLSKYSKIVFVFEEIKNVGGYAQTHLYVNGIEVLACQNCNELTEYEYDISNVDEARVGFHSNNGASSRVKEVYLVE